MLFSILYKKNVDVSRDTSTLCSLMIVFYFNKTPTSPIVVFSAALISLVGSNLK